MLDKEAMGSDHERFLGYQSEIHIKAANIADSGILVSLETSGRVIAQVTVKADHSLSGKVYM